jgi:hypothetical protein
MITKRQKRMIWGGVAGMLALLFGPIAIPLAVVAGVIVVLARPLLAPRVVG